MLNGGKAQPVSRRTSLVSFNGPGAAGVTVIPPRTPQAVANANWFTRPGQFCCIKYMRLGFFATLGIGLREFEIFFNDTATGLTTFVTRTPQYQPTAGSYTETAFSGGMGIREVYASIALTTYNTWPSEGVYFKQGDSITVREELSDYADDFVFINFTFELYN